MFLRAGLEAGLGSGHRACIKVSSEVGVVVVAVPTMGIGLWEPWALLESWTEGRDFPIRGI